MSDCKVCSMSSGLPGSTICAECVWKRLQKVESFVAFIANDYFELSYEKVRVQRDDFIKRARELQKTNVT